MSRNVFMDTGGYIALAVGNDEHHTEAVAILNKLTQIRARLYTSNFIVAETHASLLRLLNQHAASAFLKSFDKSSATLVIRPSQQDEERAKALIYRYIDKDFSFTDGLSFVVMKRYGLKEAFTFDKHFVQYGLHALRSHAL